MIFRTTYGASLNVGEKLVRHFQQAGLKNVTMKGSSRILSSEKDSSLFSWFVEAALSVIGQMKDQLIEKGLVTQEAVDRAKQDYLSLLASPSAFVLDVTVCVTGTN